MPRDRADMDVIAPRAEWRAAKTRMVELQMAA